MRIPVDVYKDVLTLLKLPHYGAALHAFDYRGRTQNSAFIVQSILEHGTVIPTQEQVGNC